MSTLHNTVLITGSGGLIGSEAARHFATQGRRIIGIDNDLRAYFFGPGASTSWNVRALGQQLGSVYEHHAIDIRDASALEPIFRSAGGRMHAIIHTAAQPSHDWAAREPHTDFAVNAVGTLNLLELTRRYCPDTPFVFTSTNKVYGDAPNRLPLEEHQTRFELPPTHRYFDGIDEEMSIDQSMHSVFGASKVAADIMTQEYGRYFGIPTVCFRGGCLTGANHSAAEQHGFLSYLMKCAMTGALYTVYGYDGCQVRDNIHASDLVAMFDAFIQSPRAGEVYNAGGGRFSNCSVKEAVALAEEITGRPMQVTYTDANRLGDHKWWISSLAKFRSHYPSWKPAYSVRSILEEMLEANRSRLAGPQLENVPALIPAPTGA